MLGLLQAKQVSADAWSPYDVKDIAFNARDVNNVCIDESGTGITPPKRYMDSHGADFLDPRAGAVRAVTRWRIVSINVPLVQTSRFNARDSGSTTRGARQISANSSNFRAAEIFFQKCMGKSSFWTTENAVDAFRRRDRQ